MCECNVYIRNAVRPVHGSLNPESARRGVATCALRVGGLEGGDKGGGKGCRVRTASLAPAGCERAYSECLSVCTGLAVFMFECVCVCEETINSWAPPAMPNSLVYHTLSGGGVGRRTRVVLVFTGRDATLTRCIVFGV